jgi:hypothetical protein
MQFAYFITLEMRMEILIAIELIVGAVVVVWFWYKNPELVLSRLSQRLMDPYDDDENVDARVHPSHLINWITRADGGFPP